MPEIKNMFIKILKVILVVIVLLAAIPIYTICLLRFSSYLERNDPMSKYLRAEKIIEETYAELSKIDKIYSDLPDGVAVAELYKYFDGWRSEYVMVYLDVLEDKKEEFVQELEVRDITEISEESVYHANVFSEDSDRVCISYLIHNGNHDFGEMISDNSYKVVYSIFSIGYAVAIIGLILLLTLAGRKREK